MVLLVDDDEDTLASIEAILLREVPDVDVTATTSPREALRLHERLTPDVIVTDYRMPGLTGLQLLQQAKRRDPGLRAVIVTADASGMGDEERARCEALARILRKPGEIARLPDEIRRLLGWGRRNGQDTPSLAEAD